MIAHRGIFNGSAVSTSFRTKPNGDLKQMLGIHHPKDMQQSIVCSCLFTIKHYREINLIASLIWLFYTLLPCLWESVNLSPAFNRVEWHLREASTSSPEISPVAFSRTIVASWTQTMRSLDWHSTRNSAGAMAVLLGWTTYGYMGIASGLAECPDFLHHPTKSVHNSMV